MSGRRQNPGLLRRCYRAQSRIALEHFAGFDQRVEHRHIQRVHLVGAHEAHIGDGVLDCYRHPIRHVVLSRLPGRDLSL